jgi:hypothetical protein
VCPKISNHHFKVQHHQIHFVRMKFRFVKYFDRMIEFIEDLICERYYKNLIELIKLSVFGLEELILLLMNGKFVIKAKLVRKLIE